MTTIKSFYIFGLGFSSSVLVNNLLLCLSGNQERFAYSWIFVFAITLSSYLYVLREEREIWHHVLYDLCRLNEKDAYDVIIDWKYDYHFELQKES